jgi:hypothetical protein
MTTIVILLALFGIKHFIADFVLQFDYMVGQKGIYGAPGGVDHAGIHGGLTALVLMLFVSMPVALVLGLLDMALHYHIDWSKMNLSRGLSMSDRKFWLLFGADQGLHYLTYILIIGLVVL